MRVEDTMPLALCEQRYADDLEAELLSELRQARHGALATLAEREVLADDEQTHPRFLDKHPHEVLGGDLRQVARELEHADERNVEVVELLDASLEGVAGRRTGCRDGGQ